MPAGMEAEGRTLLGEGSASGVLIPLLPPSSSSLSMQECAGPGRPRTWPGRGYSVPGTARAHKMNVCMNNKKICASRKNNCFAGGGTQDKRHASAMG